MLLPQVLQQFMLEAILVVPQPGRDKVYVCKAFKDVRGSLHSTGLHYASHLLRLDTAAGQQLEVSGTLP